jgi:polyvinyl alcohol dehydrogenase (cytochrome)
MSRGSILLALESGRMKAQGSQLTAEERAALAEFLGTPDNSLPGPSVGPCAAKSFSTVGDPSWNSWGVDLTNSRFQPTGSAGLGRAEVPRLKLKWAFGFPGASATYGQPTVAGGRLFVGSEDGTVYSLDARSGCTFWSYNAETTVKTAVSVDSTGRAVFFGDTNGNVLLAFSVDGK